MQRKKRISFIQKLEKERKSKVIVYITSDRVPRQFCSADIASDVLPLFYAHLKEIGKVKKISLCIRSLGGKLDAPWPLVNIIREYCQELEVIVLTKAMSAATLIALGANKIVMTPLSQLSPIDPKKDIITKDGKNIPLEVEDIISFINLAKERISIKEQIPLSEILKSLVADVPTYQLGSVHRTHSLIRRISLSLLNLHLKEKERIESIVEHLTEKLFSHQHFINRKEAKELIGFGNIIEYAEKELEALIDTIDNNYSNELEMTKPLEPLKVLGKKNEIDYKSKRAIIESVSKINTFESHLQMTKIPTVPKPQINVNVTFQGWL